MSADNSCMEKLQISAEESEIIETQLTNLLQDVRSQANVPGMGIALSMYGKNIQASAGLAAVGSDQSFDINAQFQLGCITKLITCIIAADLIDKGLLDKETPIGSYLQEFSDHENGKIISVWHLMSHTSGFQGLNLADTATAYYYQWPAFVEFLRHTPQLFTPGSVFSYDHSECVLLGEIIQRITGQSMADLYQERIFQPLGLCAGDIRKAASEPDRYVADHIPHPEGKSFSKTRSIPYGPFWHASLSSFTLSLSEIVKLGEAIVGITQPAAPFPSRTALEFVQKQVIKLPSTLGGKHPEQLPGAFGVGCAAYRGWLLGHNGSARGQTCGLRFDPKNKIVLAVGINAWQPFLRDKLINHIFGSLRGQAIPLASQDPLEYPLERLIGTYAGPLGVVCTVSNFNNTLQCDFGPQNSTRRMKVMLEQSDTGELRVATEALHHSLGFFKNPDNGEPCLMFGLAALRKSA